MDSIDSVELSKYYAIFNHVKIILKIMYLYYQQQKESTKNVKKNRKM